MSSIHVTNLRNRIAELYAEKFSHTQVRLIITKEFVSSKLLPLNAIKAAQLRHRCGGSTANFKRVKKLKSSLAITNTVLRGE